MNIALILISGVGARMGLDIPKQFLEINHRPLYLYTLDKFYHCNEISRIVLVTSNENIESVKNDLTTFHFHNVDVISGDKERYLSVINGINYISSFANDDDNILIHDGVRAGVSESIILDNIAALNSEKAVLTALVGEYSDLHKTRIDTTHKKEAVIYLAQTPQSFKFSYIKELITIYKNEPVTDEIRYVEANNDDYFVVSGDLDNFKLTEPKDLEKLSLIIKPIKKYQYYIFDFDGTLIDSRDSLFLVYQKAFDALGIFVTKEETSVFMKESIEKTFARKIPNPKTGELSLYRDIINSYINSEEVTHENKLFYDTKRMIDFVNKNHLCAGLVSGNDSEHMKEVLSYLGIEPSTFACFIGHGEVKKFKPDPEGIFLALKKMNFSGDLSSVCYVGDSLGDMMAAFNAGIDAYLVDRFNDYPLSKNYIKVNSLLDIIDK